MRAPSCAKRTAIPRPIPRLPPVISATRLTSVILLLVHNYGKLVSIAHSRNAHYRSPCAGFLPEFPIGAAPRPPSYRPPVRACPPTLPLPSSVIRPRREGQSSALESPLPASGGCRIPLHTHFPARPIRRCIPRAAR